MIGRPRNDYILVRRVQPDAMSAGGLHIPEQAREKRMETVIEAVGPGAFNPDGTRCISAPSDLAVGQRVVVSKYGGVAVEGHDDLFLVRESEILMVLDNPAGGTPAPTKEKKR